MFSPVGLAALRALFDALRSSAQIPGLGVAVVYRGQSVDAYGLGVADVESGRAVTVNTPFNIASVTKPISAVVAMRLVELGALELDRPLRRYVGFAEFSARMLTAGGAFFEDWCGADPDFTMRHALTMTGNGVLGDGFLYNPVAFSWMSRPMAEVADTPFSSLVAEHVFAAAGMTRSDRIHRGRPLRDDLAGDLARPHTLAPSGEITGSVPPPEQGDGAAGGVISTVRDLVRFDLALDRGQLLTPKSRAQMWRPAGRGLPYGIGWFTERVRGERTVWHSGLWEGAYSALYLKVPRRHASLILLANADGLRWPAALDEGAVERSPFAQAFFDWLEGQS